jgi:DNA-binding NarL/FixJ family response regulator
MRVLLGDDHALVLNGIRTLLEATCHIVGCASNGRQLVDLAIHLKPQLVILDVSMPELNGLEAALRIKAALPSTQLIFLTMHTGPQYLRRAFDAGARGYVLKTGLVEELLQAISEVTQGQIYISPGFGVNAADELLSHPRQRTCNKEPLTGRQKEILQLIAEGRFSKEIAHILGISLKTVDFHRARIMTRLGVHSVAELIRVAIEQELIAARSPEES